MRKIIEVPKLDEYVLEAVHQYFIEVMKIFFEKYGYPMNKTHISCIRKWGSDRRETEKVLVLTEDGINCAYYDYRIKNWKFCDSPHWANRKEPSTKLVVNKFLYLEDSKLEYFKEMMFDYLTTGIVSFYHHYELKRCINNG